MCLEYVRVKKPYPLHGNGFQLVEKLAKVRGEKVKPVLIVLWVRVYVSSRTTILMTRVCIMMHWTQPDP